MASSPTKTVKPPRIPKRLAAGTLAALEDDGDYSNMEVTGGRYAASAAARCVFEVVIFRRAVFGPSRCAKPRFLDCRLDACDLSGIDWEQARFRRVELLGCRGIGAQLVESEWEDACFREGNWERAVFTAARFRAAHFTGCSLRETSWEGADLTGAVFEDCDLTRADFRGSKLQDVDLRGSALDGAQAGWEEWKGAIVDPRQAVQVAGLLGIAVREKGE
ncbi:MAG: pentapeptide repeat-containing protein [Anaerolineales bacterium]|nr:pentapeptide repeat-containing protein [Anaerolineales bacterium]